jgi:tRNA-uridine 2-sulfurtransferase
VAGALAVIAMSGGVDSSVAAALLLEAGYRVEGVSLRLWDSQRRGDRVCSDHRDASRVARHLGIAHSVIDRRAAFERRVVAPFVVDYQAGRTPNPCVACNGEFKLGWLLDWALERGAERIATGHYARIEVRCGRLTLRRGVDPLRDQSYFLFSLTARQLERAAFPLGEWAKADVRRRAAELGLPVAEKLDSQDLCFGDPAALVRARQAGGEAGDVVDEAGKVLGEHRGVEAFTVGQRRGLGVASSSRLYVQSIDGPSARIVVGPKPPRARALLARDWSWIGEPASANEPLAVQVRYRHPAAPARIVFAGGRCRVRVEFDSPVAAVAPGQAVVAYRGEEVLGGGWIERAVPPEDGA